MRFAGKSLVVIAAIAAGAWFGGVAGAQESTTYAGSVPEVLSEQLVPSAPVTGVAENAAQPIGGEVSPAQLALTGGDVTGLAIIGIAALAFGLLLIRRRTASA